MFRGRKLVIATKHQKEKALAPLLEKELGVSCFVTPLLDTDQLGTFSGEVERKDDPITTARNKCLLAMQLTNCDLAVASEGSFGSHPTIYFVPADDEFLLFLDKKNGLEIVVREVSTETNFFASEIKSEKELRAIANKVSFPSHALIAKRNQKDVKDLVKGIQSWEKLEETYYYFLKEYGSFYLETDMRAMFNPTRMNVIEKAAKKLVDKINSFCPECSTPGFGISNATKGLPCQFCQFPTRSILSYNYICSKCAFTKQEMYPHNKRTEDPMFCDNCNP
jgi:hypothetical protein